MLSTLCMPKLSPTMTTGVIAKWHKSINQRLETGDLLLEVATDKATIEHHAMDPGWLREILVPEGKAVDVGTPIAVISSVENEPIGDYTPVSLLIQEKVETQAERIAPPSQKSTTPISTRYERIPASPLARKIASLEDLSLAGIKGSGPGGRIMSKDLEIPLLKKSQSHLPAVTFRVPEGMELTPLTPLRATIAKNLQYAKSTIPHFYINTTVDVSDLVLERERLKAASIHLTVNDLLIVATAKALMEHPAIRSSFYPDKNAIGIHKNADIAVAVSIPGGLITPIIKEAQNKTPLEIAKEVRELAQKAKQGKLQPHEYMGGAITITNLGMFGIDQFLPILNAPQVAILSVGAITEVPIVKNGAIVPGKIVCLTVAADHRALDGTDVAEFLKTLKLLLSKPKELVSTIEPHA